MHKRKTLHPTQDQDGEPFPRITYTNLDRGCQSKSLVYDVNSPRDDDGRARGLERLTRNVLFVEKNQNTSISTVSISRDTNILQGCVAVETFKTEELNVHIRNACTALDENTRPLYAFMLRRPLCHQQRIRVSIVLEFKYTDAEIDMQTTVETIRNRPRPAFNVVLVTPRSTNEPHSNKEIFGLAPVFSWKIHSLDESNTASLNLIKNAVMPYWHYDWCPIQRTGKVVENLIGVRFCAELSAQACSFGGKSDEPRFVWMFSNEHTVPVFEGAFGKNDSDYMYWDSVSESWRADGSKVHVGSAAGQTQQGEQAVAIGANAGNKKQKQYAVSVGSAAGQTDQSFETVAVGWNAGNDNQKEFAVAIGSSAGKNFQGKQAIAIGNQAGAENQKDKSISIGLSAGGNDQGSSAIAIGANAGYYNQEKNTVSIGESAGQLNQGSEAVAVGWNAGNYIQKQSAIAIGSSAGKIGQSKQAVAIGNKAGFSAQKDESISIGSSAGCDNQGVSAIAIGTSAGYSSQKPNAVAIGITAGRTNQGIDAIAIGNKAGFNAQRDEGISIGSSAGNYLQGISAIAIGTSAGYNSQKTKAVAIGASAGQTDQDTNAIAIGTSAGSKSQKSDSIAIGKFAGETNQNGAIAIGAGAGFEDQNKNAISIGNATGTRAQGEDAVAIGQFAGNYRQNKNAVAIGLFAGNVEQSENALAIGKEAAQYKQGACAISLGIQAGLTEQGRCAIAIGESAGTMEQKQNAIAIGLQAGSHKQYANAVAIGNATGLEVQGENAVAIGGNAGKQAQGVKSVAVGWNAGSLNQGSCSIAIGANAGATGQHKNSIVLNASENPLNTAAQNTFYVRPVRVVDETAAGQSAMRSMLYDKVTGEVVTATSKTFVIDHPTDVNRYLVHACLEGPESGVYYRGRGQLVDGVARVFLPDYVVVPQFADEFTIHTTPIGRGRRALAVSELRQNDSDGQCFFDVYNTDFHDACLHETKHVKNNDGPFHWTAIGRRLSIEAQPVRETTQVLGQGPYRWVV